MIVQNDIEFHTPQDVDYKYAETNYFCLTIPEEGLMASVYVVIRKGLGVMVSDIVVFSTLTDSRAECAYIDCHQHLPAPDKLSDFTTENGLTIKAFSPRDYRVDYVGYDDTEIHFDFKGLMEPFDIHDPDHSPMAKRTIEEQHAGSGLGAAYGGHFDLTGRITGTLKLYGKEYRVDCIETMDHSWGARPERALNAIGWMHAHFGENFAIHWINSWDMDKPVGTELGLAHGYVMEDGQVYGLTNLKMRAVRTSSMLIGVEVEATDKRGKTYRLSGSAQVGAPWVSYTSILLYASLMRWTLGDGRVGYGMSQESQPLQQLTRRYGRRWDKFPSKIGA